MSTSTYSTTGKRDPDRPPQRIAESGQLVPLQHKIADAARMLAMSKRTIERLIASGELDTVGTGQLRRIPDDSIVAYIERHRNEVA